MAGLREPDVIFSKKVTIEYRGGRIDYLHELAVELAERFPEDRVVMSSGLVEITIPLESEANVRIFAERLAHRIGFDLGEEE